MSEESLFKAISSLQNYNSTKEFRTKIIQGDQKIMNVVQYVICQTLRLKTSTPIQKFLAIRLAKDSIETFNDEFISQCQITILPKIEEIAVFKKESQEEDKGKYYFDPNPTPQSEMAKLGKSILQLTLECIWVWSKWFPVDPETQMISHFKLTMEKLIKIGVNFPKLEYFSFDFVMKQVPDVMVPIKMLKEARQVIDDDIRRNLGGTSKTKTIIEQLYVILRKELNRKERDEVFYSEKLRRALRNRKFIKDDDCCDYADLQQTQVKSQYPKSYQVSPVREQIMQYPQYDGFTQVQLKTELLKQVQFKENLEKELKQVEEIVKYLHHKTQSETTYPLSVGQFTQPNSSRFIAERSPQVVENGQI